MNLDEEAKARFGFGDLREGQREVLRRLMEGRSAAAVFPTGGGKSLCYQLPSQLLEGTTLVVSPLIALMKDQIDALAVRGIVAHRLDSTLSAEEYRTAIDDVRQGRAKLVYVSPERFNNERFRNQVRGWHIALFAVDEAHCISEWGHNFRPDYLKLVRYAREAKAERIVALTATATTEVANDICKGFDIAEEDLIRTRFARDNLALRLTPVSADERLDRLQEGLAERPRGATLVYVSLQKTAEQVAETLRAAGHDARAYHAGLPPERRADVQEWFLGSKEGIVVATIAFGMGVDKPNIRYVYHYNLAKSLEGLAQEIGRAGRDGEPAVVESLVCTADLTVLENFAYGDTPDRHAVEALIAMLEAGEAEQLLALTSMSRELDIRLLVLKTLLTYLELDGWFEMGTPVYSAYRFVPHRTGREILAAIPEEERAFTGAVLKAVRPGKKWMNLDPDDAARRTGGNRAAVVRTLQHLDDEGHIALEASQVRHRFRRLRAIDDAKAVVDDLMQKLESREHKEIERIGEVVALCALDGCQAAALGERFGDPPGSTCGQCSHCLRGAVPPLERKASEAPADKVRAGHAVLAEEGEVGEAVLPRQLARFLCGLATPGLPKTLSRHPLFGTLQSVPFGKVLKAAETL